MPGLGAGLPSNYSERIMNFVAAEWLMSSGMLRVFRGSEAVVGKRK
jgi:hypothetical protein